MEKEKPFLTSFFSLTKKKKIPLNFILEGEHLFLKNQQKFFIKTIACSAHGKCQPLCSFCQKKDYSGNFFLEISNEEKTLKVADIKPLFAWSYNWSPGQKIKIYWIDQAEKMTLASSNKILKFLEEPPLNCFGILTTNNAQLLPLTVRSRLPLFTFYQTDREQKAKITTLADLSLQDQTVLLNFNHNFLPIDDDFLQLNYYPAKDLLENFFQLARENKLEDFYFDLEKIPFSFYFFLELVIIYFKLSLTNDKFINDYQIFSTIFTNLEKLLIFSCQIIYQNQVFYQQTKNNLNWQPVALNWLNTIISNFLLKN